MFDAKKVKDELVQWIKDWFAVNGKDCNAVLGISGGKDSTICAALCVEALGKDRVIGVMMPNSVQKDISDSIRVCEILGIRNYTINIGVAFDPLLQEISKQTGITDFTNQTLTNLPPRIRMATVYAISQSNNGRVINTSNASERFIGWGTMYGDCVGDVSLLGNLTKTEVCMIGDALGLPAELVHKVPADGLTTKSDEDNLGFTYAEMDVYMRTGVCENEEHKQMIEQRHKNSAFKRNGMFIFSPSEPV